MHLPGVVCKPQTPGSYHVLPISLRCLYPWLSSQTGQKYQEKVPQFLHQSLEQRSLCRIPQWLSPRHPILPLRLVTPGCFMAHCPDNTSTTHGWSSHVPSMGVIFPGIPCGYAIDPMAQWFSMLNSKKKISKLLPIPIISMSHLQINVNPGWD